MWPNKKCTRGDSSAKDIDISELRSVLIIFYLLYMYVCVYVCTYFLLLGVPFLFTLLRVEEMFNEFVALCRGQSICLCGSTNSDTHTCEIERDVLRGECRYEPS